MISNIIAAETSSIVMIVILLVLFVGMMAISIIPQRKKQKEYAAMQEAIKVGTRIMTIGRLVGTVVAINTDNTLEVDIGAKGSPVIIVINREGIGLNLDAQAPAAAGNNTDNGAPAQGDVDSDDAPLSEDKKDDKTDDSI